MNKVLFPLFLALCISSKDRGIFLNNDFIDSKSTMEKDFTIGIKEYMDKKGTKSIVVTKRIFSRKKGTYDVIIIREINAYYLYAAIIALAILLLACILLIIFKIFRRKRPKAAAVGEKKAYKSFLFIKLLNESYKDIEGFTCAVNDADTVYNARSVPLPNQVYVYALAAAENESEILKGVDMYTELHKKFSLSGLIHSEDVDIINDNIVNFFNLQSCITGISMFEENELYLSQSSLNEVKSDISFEKSADPAHQHIIGRQELYKVIL
ncbi:hypothetical protein ACFL6D_05540 [Spirochaetota bacterium]